METRTFEDRRIDLLETLLRLGFTRIEIGMRLLGGLADVVLAGVTTAQVS